MLDDQKIADYAKQCGADWVSVDKLALHKTRKGVSIFFSSEHKAEEFCYHVRDWFAANDSDYEVTREKEFVLIWL